MNDYVKVFEAPSWFSVEDIGCGVQGVGLRRSQKPPSLLFQTVRD